jgi:hypothetical protein
MFDAALPPKVWTPARPAIVRAASLKDVEKATFPFPFMVPVAWATWNPNDKSAPVVLSNNNLTATTSAAGLEAVRATAGLSSGKWYWELTFTGSSSVNCLVGIGKASAVFGAGGPGSDANGWGYYSNDGTKYSNNSASAYGSGYGILDTIGIAFDADNGRLFFRKNGSWVNTGDPVAGTNAAFTGLTSGPYYPMVGDGTSGIVTVVFIANFGASTFSSAAPTGYGGLR